MPYVDSNGKIVEKPQGILQGYSFNGILNGILTFLMAIIAFFQSMIFPLIGHNASSRVSRFFGGSNDRRGGPGGGNGGNGGGGGGGNRPIGRLNTSTMDSASCPTGGCSGGGCG